ncbi:MAG: zinc-dependent metalloprotease, partial [Actinomycetes bacterium]
MSDIPFGFGSADRDPDDERRRDAERRGDGPQDPFGLGNIPGMPGGGFPGMPGGPGGFDVSQLGQMLTQLGQMLSQAQSSGGGPVNSDLAAQMARQQLAATT